VTQDGRNWTARGIVSPSARFDVSPARPLQETLVKFVRVLIAAAAALAAALAVQMAGSSGASATTSHFTTNDCGACWYVQND
jgi:hypothetical protein